MSIVLREQEQLIALKVEATYGTDATPVGADAIMVQDITVSLLEGDVAERANFTGFMGNQGSVRLNTYCSLEFSIELSGSGTADVPPYFSSIYKISGHSQAVTAATDVAYALSDDAQDAGTIYYLVGEHKHAITGVRGTLSLELGTKQLPRLKFSGFGLYAPPVKAVGGLAGVNFATVLKPLPWTVREVETLTLHGIAVNAASFSFEQGMSPEFLALTAEEEVILPSRSSKFTLKIREDELATANWFEISRANAVGAFTMQHGKTGTHDGRIFAFNAPNVDVSGVSRSFEQGIAMLELSCGIIPTAKGNDYSFAHS